MSKDAATAAQHVGAAIHDAGRGLVEREALVEWVVLAAVAQEHILVIGPPGTAKSEAVRRISTALGCTYFEYLLGRFTEPSEIVGPMDLRKLREGILETATQGMLPEAHVAFLDEVFQGSTAILNTLLGILNERTFRRGHAAQTVPLRVCVGASNALPDDPSLAAFADRFLVRAYVDAVPDVRLEELLEGGWQGALEGGAQATLEDLDTLAAAARAMDLGPVRGRIAQAIRTLRAAGVSLSDRRAVKCQKLVAAAAVLAGRAVPTMADLWPLVLAVPTQADQALAREVLRELLVSSDNAALSAAAEEASQGPQARARRLVDAATELLKDAPAGDARDQWRLKLEGVVREVDAGFATASMTDDLKGVRARIVAALETPSP